MGIKVEGWSCLLFLLITLIVLVHLFFVLFALVILNAFAEGGRGMRLEWRVRSGLFYTERI
tara:strand:+ start:1655 stop:1837 length:183 start_codon:yes stop_codon:yes gene_type:complete